MAIKEDYRSRNIEQFCLIVIIAAVCFSNVDCLQNLVRHQRSVVQFDSQTVDNVISHSVQLNANGVEDFKRSLHKRDVSCASSEITDTSIDKSYTFTNETKTAMALAWAGENDGTLIIVTSDSGAKKASTVFRSTDYGVTYENLTKTMNIVELIKKHNGLQRHPLDPKRVYLVGEASILYVTKDGGMSWNKVDLNGFQITGELIFHTSPDHTDKLMAFEGKSLYISQDNGMSWKLVKTGVDKAVWGVLPETGDKPGTGDDKPWTIYYTYGAKTIDDIVLQHFLDIGFNKDYTLARSDDAGVTSSDILQKVVVFERQGHFLYASTARDSKTDQKTMMVSVNGGKSFDEAQLPTIDSDMFYSVVDIEDHMIFMHVDNPGDTGHGTLYTSANRGVVYSISLPKHLFPNYNTIHDFYKVKSMRGVYITSQMSNDQSIHTMITYNMGATWQKIPAPDNAPCKDVTKECNLHIHGMYSIDRKINAMLPISEKTATGIILAHGHVADALQKTPPDVFVSSDGGYSWSLSLAGPHHYQIGDHGGLLVAVSKSEPNPKYVKFSTDEGRCWRTYKFTDKLLNFTGLLTEPEGKSSVVMLWGYLAETKKWEVHVIDFKTVLGRQCSDTNDYEVWTAHATHRANEGAETVGCLLGVKESFKRLKKNSECYNGYDHEVTRSQTSCKCTREDYECDYGFYRPGGSDECVKDTDFQGPEIDICLHGHDKRLVSKGYRKIPGDNCMDGFKPTTTVIDLDKQCDEFGHSIQIFDEMPVIKVHNNGTVTGANKHAVTDATIHADGQQVHVTTSKPMTSGQKVSSSNSTRSENLIHQTQESGTTGFSKGIKIFAVILVIAVLALASTMAVFFVHRFILLRRHKTEYRYSRLSQSEQHQSLIGGDNDDDDEREGNLERDLDKALASSTVKYDSDEELTTTSSLPKKTAKTNGNLKPIPKPADNNPFGNYHDDSDDDMLS